MNSSHARDALIHIADLHFWRIVWNPFRMLNKRFLGNLTVLFKRRFEFALEQAERFADAVAATGAPDVLLTGDFASTATDAEFALGRRFVEGLQRRGLNVHLLPGNHDVYTFEAARAQRFERHFREFLPPAGYPSLHRLSGGASLLLVPGVCPRHLSARGRIAREEVEATRALLEQADPRVIVGAHYPVLHRTHGYASHPFRRLENAELLHEALGASGKRILYLSGHVHRFSFENDPRFPGLQHVTTGGFFRKNRQDGSDGEFTRIEAIEDGFRVFRHLHRGEWSAAEALPGGRT